MAATRSGFERGGGEDPGDEIRIPTAGHGYRLRKTGASLGHVAVQYFVMKNRRYAQPGVLDQPLLHCVGEDRSLARAHSLSLSGDLPDPVRENLRGPFQEKTLRGWLRNRSVVSPAAVPAKVRSVAPLSLPESCDSPNHSRADQPATVGSCNQALSPATECHVPARWSTTPQLPPKRSN